MIKAKGLNGYGKAPEPTPAPDVTKETAVTVTVQIGDDNYSGTLTKV